MNFDPYLAQYIEINSKLITDLNVRPKLLNLVEENEGEKLTEDFCF